MRNAQKTEMQEKALNQIVNDFSSTDARIIHREKGINTDSPSQNPKVIID